MIVVWASNPLQTVIHLEENERANLRLKLQIEDLQERIYSAFFCLEPGDRFDPAAALAALRIDTLQDEPMSKQIDEIMELYTGELRGEHSGDCTCVPCSCAKCHAEYLVGVDTIKGMNKYTATSIHSAFANQRTGAEAAAWLETYKPERTGAWLSFSQEDFDQQAQRWIKHAADALVWLRTYQREKLGVV